MTAAQLDSEPVAGNVSTVPSGSADSMRAPFDRISRLALNGTAAATNFAPSSTEPPPTRIHTRSHASATPS